MQKQFMKHQIFDWSKISRGSASATKIYVRRERGGRGETVQKNSASWLGMINKPVKEGCTVGRGRGEVIMWQRIIFLSKMPLGGREQENMRILPVHTVTLQRALRNLLMESCSLMPPANSAFAKSHLLLITYRQLPGLNLLTLLLVWGWS